MGGANFKTPPFLLAVIGLSWYTNFGKVYKGELSMGKEITIQEALSLKNTVFIDIRSPGEYLDATIPGAINIPLFENDERAEIGTIYKQISPELAKLRGLEIAGPKISRLVKDVKEKSDGRIPIIFCWRGGHRSKFFSYILNFVDIENLRLIGGYKAYRRLVYNYFSIADLPKAIVLYGNTGTGKTELINELIKRQIPAVDLEYIANNRGSVFGSIGLGKQPSQKNFEALLYKYLSERRDKYVFVEGESKRIGRLLIPNRFFEKMQNGIKILIYADVETRIKRIVETYLQNYWQDPEQRKELELAVCRLKHRLGCEKVQVLLDLLETGDLDSFARILIEEYYDQVYGLPNQPDASFDYCIASNNFDECISELEKIFRSINYDA